MTLDIPTLMLAGSFVALLSGAVLIFIWSEHRDMGGVLTWGIANLVLSLSIAAMAYGGVSANDGLVSMGFTGLVLSPALTWHAALLATLRRPHYVLTAAGPAVLLLVALLPLGPAREAVRGILGSGLDAVYLLAAAWCLARHPDRLVSRWPLTAFLVLHAAVLLTGPIAAIQAHGMPSVLAPITSLFGLIHFEALVFIIGATVFIVSAVRETSELKLRRTASLDSLTGLLNRGGFIETAEAAAEACRQNAMPYAVIVFDLDHFKLVNDRFGHATGDSVLKLFAAVMQKSLRPSDIIGRVGGEEFAVLLPRADLAAAAAVAERSRKMFEAAAMIVDGRRMAVTLSAGVVAAGPQHPGVMDLVEEADRALYRAKANGRNRVETAATDGGPPEPQRIVRVA